MVDDDGPVSSIEQLRLASDGRCVTDRIGLRGQDLVTAIDLVEVEIAWADLDLDIEQSSTAGVATAAVVMPGG
ncbi:hypothetical protein ACFQ9R_20935 [Nocardia sp. NPDC056541]|uniref:hypothetical protein n=1 Tax=Nocardia sp. NPDC056541 TaxID=3345860 RepID=UPI00366C342D